MKSHRCQHATGYLRTRHGREVVTDWPSQERQNLTRSRLPLGRPARADVRQQPPH